MLALLKKRFTYYIGDIVYGANDGIITTFAVIAGAAGAGFSSSIIIVLGIANLIADGFSMGASKYLSLSSEQSVDKAGSEKRSPFEDGAATFVAFVLAGSLPLIPFLVLPKASEHSFTISAIATAFAFFIVGAARTFVIRKNFFVAGLEMLIVGGAAAVIAYGLGAWVETLIR